MTKPGRISNLENKDTCTCSEGLRCCEHNCECDSGCDDCGEWDAYFERNERVKVKKRGEVFGRNAY